jgi:hypothetical protein
MASSVTNKYPVYPQTIGDKRVSVVDKFGPASYDNGVGETLSTRLFGFQNLEAILGGVDSTGVYYAAVYKTPGEQGTWVIQWYTLSGMTEVVATTDLAAVVVQLVAIGN